MLKFDLPWLHIGALGLANFFIGFAWYSVIFQKPWMRALNITAERMRSEENRRKMPVLMGSAALTAFTLAFGAQVLVASLGAADALSGGIAGFFVAVVFVVAHESGSLFEGRPYSVYGISALHALTVLTLDGAALAAWR